MGIFNKQEDTVKVLEKREYEIESQVTQSEDAGSSVSFVHTKRTLTSRTLHMIAIGGSIGTGLFVTISTGLYKGGAGSLFLAYFLWTLVIFSVVASVGEMVCYLPISAPFIQMAGRCIDEAFEVVQGFNYYIMISCYIPFEIVAVNSMIHYWRDDYSQLLHFVFKLSYMLL